MIVHQICYSHHSIHVVYTSSLLQPDGLTCIQTWFTETINFETVVAMFTFAMATITFDERQATYIPLNRDLIVKLPAFMLLICYVVM